MMYRLSLDPNLCVTQFDKGLVDLPLYGSAKA